MTRPAAAAAIAAEPAEERCPVRVALTVFEGTLDRLIGLVRRDERLLLQMEAHDMTAQLLAQVENLRIQDVGVAVVLSAQIVALKAAALRRFAGETETPDEAREADHEMVTLLLECKALVAELREDDGGRVTTGTGWVEPVASHRPRARASQAATDPEDAFTLDDLDRELGALEREVTGANVIAPAPYPRERVLGDLERRLASREAIAFGEFDDEATGFRIALFLALLEEVRSRRFLLSQPSPADDILIRRP